MKQNNIEQILSAHSVIPVVTIYSLDEVDSVIAALIAKNIRVIEVTLRTEVAFDAIKKIKTSYAKEMCIGVGTVVNVDQMKDAKSAGVDFIVCPGLEENLILELQKSGIPFIPGVATPSEIMQGIQLGCSLLKFFPANLFGGLEALKTYAQVFPSVQFCPTGGITEDTYSSYLELKNVISVGGSWMMKK
jgi:2-dehydro-3-deoxyphosphogluconate aldolase/(4S)-4-hydroxy-2-oxoglutarate aldolase